MIKIPKFFVGKKTHFEKRKSFQLTIK